jgi:phospholipid/cholesterol/gamma-HCH transport system substrate-binding protein
MQPIRERALVGLFVIVAAAVLVAAVFTMNGTFARSVKTYHAYFPFAGGIEVGSTVRYSGGPKVGRVESLRVDPNNPSRFDITFSVQSDMPVKTDSHVKIMSMNPLGDNHLEVIPGSAQAPLAQDQSFLASENYLDFNALTEQINTIAPQAQELLHSLNDRVTEVKVTVERVNDLLNAQNRANVAMALSSARGMIEEDRPEVKSTLQNVNGASVKIGPLLDNLRKTSDQATQALNHVDSTIGENRPDVRQAVSELRQTLTNMTAVTARLDQTLDANSENIDELLDNIRRATENLNEFTATIKARPYSLIRATNPREHQTGEPK